jgi:Phage protein Gp19/Gp15/Gp42
LPNSRRSDERTNNVPYAQASDVATLLGRALTPEETAMVDRRLAEVERHIKRRIPDLDDKFTAGDIDAADVVQVEADVVLRLVRNPEGYASESDGTYGYTFSREVASGRLEILPEEWEVLGVRIGRICQLVPSPLQPANVRTPFGMGG